MLAVFLIATLACVAPVKARDIIIGETMTLKDVFAMGFRPSNITHEGGGTIRCWERQEVTLIFANDFHYRATTDSLTFRVYDDDQIGSLELEGDRSHQLTLREAEEEARRIYGQFAPVPDEFESWLARVKKQGYFETFGHGVHTRYGHGLSVELRATLKPLNSTPATVALGVNWPYHGHGRFDGLRTSPVVTPPGYDWDMSFEAWSARIKAGNDRKTLGLKLLVAAVLLAAIGIPLALKLQRTRPQASL